MGSSLKEVSSSGLRNCGCRVTTALTPLGRCSAYPFVWRRELPSLSVQSLWAPNFSAYLDGAASSFSWRVMPSLQCGSYRQRTNSASSLRHLRLIAHRLNSNLQLHTILNVSRWGIVDPVNLSPCSSEDLTEPREHSAG